MSKLAYFIDINNISDKELSGINEIQNKEGFISVYIFGTESTQSIPFKSLARKVYGQNLLFLLVISETDDKKGVVQDMIRWINGNVKNNIDEKIRIISKNEDLDYLVSKYREIGINIGRFNSIKEERENDKEIKKITPDAITEYYEKKYNNDKEKSLEDLEDYDFNTEEENIIYFNDDVNTEFDCELYTGSDHFINEDDNKKILAESEVEEMLKGSVKKI